ncbi:uncharacterized protein LOC116033243 [Ipomoea triloba]|uniref:uncharacterized protein LOC116033243 n=1 Tax=Ipomoea triloba TaxID=35885 RepID=UPI00125D74F8|nr:uncharacterized protein LOC116033243 [Ipomoea triloba]
MTVQHKINWIKEADHEISKASTRPEDSNTTVGRSRTIWLRWRASTDHCFTLNVDGNVKYGTQKAGIGGVIRNDKGEWIGGIMCRTCYEDPTIVEARAIVECLDWAWKKGICDLEVQSDASQVVQWIQDDLDGRRPIRQCIEEVKR